MRSNVVHEKINILKLITAFLDRETRRSHAVCWTLGSRTNLICPEPLCCVLGYDTLLSQFLSPLGSIHWCQSPPAWRILHHVIVCCKRPIIRLGLSWRLPTPPRGGEEFLPFVPHIARTFTRFSTGRIQGHGKLETFFVGFFKARRSIASSSFEGLQSSSFKNFHSFLITYCCCDLPIFVFYVFYISSQAVYLK